MKKLFDQGWEFKKLDCENESKVEQVTIPHCFNAHDMGSLNQEYYIGKVQYKNTIKKVTTGRCLIEFEAIGNRSEVYIGGVYIGGSNEGFLGFRIDITEFLTEEENEIVVIADNSYAEEYTPPKHIDWDRYGGMYRPCWLYYMDDQYIAYNGLKVRTPVVNQEKATLTADLTLFGTDLSPVICQVEVSLFDKNHTCIYKDEKENLVSYYKNTIYHFETEVIKPKLWSNINPNLYELKAVVKKDGKIIDETSSKVGFRFYHFDKEKGFILNGIPIKLIGTNMHQDYPGLGNGCTEEFFLQEMKLLKQAGMNYMRGSHYPRNKYFLDLCDENGIIVMEEQPFWHGSIRNTNHEQYVLNGINSIKEMVAQHGNHPSILFWNVANELLLAPVYTKHAAHTQPEEGKEGVWLVPECEYPYIKMAISRFYNTYKEIDPTRLVSYVTGRAWPDNYKFNLTNISDFMAYNGGCFNYRIKPLIGPTTGKEYFFPADYIHDEYPDVIGILSEGIANDEDARAVRGVWQQENESWTYHAKYWNDIYKREWFTGGTIWTFSDYYANGFYRNMAITDEFRVPYESFYLYQSNFSQEPFIHILGHWDEEGDSTRNIVIFTNQENIQLNLNGEIIPVEKDKNYPHLPHSPYVAKNIQYVKGVLEAKSGELSHQVTTSSLPKSIDLICNLLKKPTGESLATAFIDGTIVDENNNRCFTLTATVTVEVQGATLMQNMEIPVRAGILRFPIIINQAEEKIIIKAKCQDILGILEL